MKQLNLFSSDPNISAAKRNAGADKKEEKIRARNKLGNSFNEPLASAMRSAYPMFKGNHFGTGSGKTYFAALMSDPAFKNNMQLIFVTSNKTLVEQARALFHKHTKMPVYVSYGREDQWSDDIIKNDLGKVLNEVSALKKVVPEVWDALIQQFKNSRRSLVNDFEVYFAQCRLAYERLKTIVHDQQSIQTSNPEHEQYLKRQRTFWTSQLELLVKTLTCVDITNRFTRSHAKVTARLCRRIFPLDYALLVEPGPIIMNHSKYATGPVMATRTVPKQKPAGDAPVPPTHVAWSHFINKEFHKGVMQITDEEEDYYKRLLDALKITVTSPHTWFPTITSMAVFFMWNMFKPDQSGDPAGWRLLLFNNLQSVVSHIDAIELAIESYRNGQITEDAAKEELLAALGLRKGDHTLASNTLFSLMVHQWFRPRLARGEHVEKKYAWYGLGYYCNCWKTILRYRQFIDRFKLFADSVTEMERWNRFAYMVTEKHRLVIDRDNLAEIGGQMQYLFFDDRLRLVDQRMLHEVFVRILPDNGDMEIVYRPERVDTDLFSLNILLRLFLWTAIVATDRTISIPRNTQVDEADLNDVQQINTFADYFHRKAFGLRLAEVTLDQLECGEDLIVDEELIFEKAKGFLTIATDTQTIRATRYVSASFSISALTRSPESVTLAGLLGPEGSEDPYRFNMHYYLSHTSGIGGFWELDRRYMEPRIVNAGGAFEGFTIKEEHIAETLRDLSPRSFQIGFARDGGLGQVIQIDPVNPKLLAGTIPPPIGNPLYRDNRHKRNEMDNLFASLSYLCEQDGPHAGMFFTQSTTHILDAFETGIAQGSIGLRRADPKLAQIYEIDPAAIGLVTTDPRPIIVVLFEASFLKRRHYGPTAFPNQYLLLDNDEDEQTEQVSDQGPPPDSDDEDIPQEVMDKLQEALNPYSHLNRNKILFVTRYISSDRGLSIHCYQKNPAGETEERDYDFVTLSNSRYYNSFTRRKDGNRASIEQFFGALRRLYADDGAGTLSLTELSHALVLNLYQFLNQYGLLESFTDLIQVLGRGDRGRALPELQRFFINEDYVPILIDGNEAAGNFLKRSSKTGYAAITAAAQFMEAKSPAIIDFHRYLDEEITLAQHFLDVVERFTHDLFYAPDPHFRAAVCRAWAAIRDPRAITDPAAYIAALRSTPWPYGDESRRRFIEYCYMSANAYGGDPHYLRVGPTDQFHSGEPIQVIVDFKNRTAGSRTYRPAEELFHQDLLNAYQPTDYRTMCSRLGFDNPKLFSDFIPRPHFLKNFLQGFVGEMLTQEALRSAGIEILPDEWAISRGIFERYDTYCRLKNGRLATVDSKYWSRNTDAKLSADLLRRGPEKAQMVAEATGERPFAVYLNTFGGTYHPPVREANFEIEFISLFTNERDAAGRLTPSFKRIFHGDRQFG